MHSLTQRRSCLHTPGEETKVVKKRAEICSTVRVHLATASLVRGFIRHFIFQAGVLRNGGKKGVRRPQSMAEGEKRRTKKKKKKKKSELGGYGVPFFPLLFSSLPLAPRPNTHGLEKGRAQN